MVQRGEVLVVLEDTAGRWKHTPMHQVALQARQAPVVLAPCPPLSSLVPLVVGRAEAVEVCPSQFRQRLATKRQQRDQQVQNRADAAFTFGSISEFLASALQPFPDRLQSWSVEPTEA